MKSIIYKFTFLLLLFSGSNTFSAQEINIKLNNNTKSINTKKIDLAVKNLNILKEKKEITSGLINIDINVNINSYKKDSYSNYDNKNCKIEINYTKDLKNFVLKDLSSDLMMATLHEIGHCILGRDVLTREPEWSDSLNLSNDEKNHFTKIVIKKRKEAFVKLKERKCSEDKKCTAFDIFEVFPPMIIYHEIFADLWALSKLKDISCELGINSIKDLNNFRMKEFYKNTNLLHQSFLSIYYSEKDFKCDTKFDFKKITLYTQKGFIDYLSNY